MANPSNTVAVYVNGAAELQALQTALNEVWREQLCSPSAAFGMAKILRTQPEKLSALNLPPVQLEPVRSGLAVSEIAVQVCTWVATEIVLKTLSDLGKDALKNAIRKVWNEYLERALMDKMKQRGALGERREDNAK